MVVKFKTHNERKRRSRFEVFTRSRTGTANFRKLENAKNFALLIDKKTGFKSTIYDIKKDDIVKVEQWKEYL